MDNKKRHHCSFCGKHDLDIDILIAGASVFICNECVEICNKEIAYIKMLRHVEQDKEQP